MRKGEVETHAIYHPAGPEPPAVNVKCYGPYRGGKVQDKFDCTEEVAERALRWQFESAQQRFWEDVQGWAEECFGKGVKVWSAGRQGGWAVAEGLPDLKDWDAIQLGKWAKFAKMCDQEVKYRTSEEVVMEDIEANRWAEENSEQYNYVDANDGMGIICLADVSRCAHCG